MIPNITNILLGELEEQAIGEISLSNGTDGHSTRTAAYGMKKQLLSHVQVPNWKKTGMCGVQIRS